MHYYNRKPVGLLYDHPHQFNPLLKMLDRRGVPYELIDPGDHQYDPLHREVPYSLVFNDMSLPPYLNKKQGSTTQLLSFTHHLEVTSMRLLQGRIINGSNAVNVFSSRARQLSVFAAAEVLFPYTRIVNSLDQLLAVLPAFKFPVLLKPDNRWIGIPVTIFRSQGELLEAIINNEVTIENKGSMLVQAYVEPRHRQVVRVEMLNGKYLSASKIITSGESLYARPIEVSTEIFKPSTDIIEAAEAIVRLARVDLGSVEYIVDRKNNQLLFIGIKPHTTAFRTPAFSLEPNFESIANYVERRIQKIKEMELAL
jgi:hypothetical protein